MKISKVIKKFTKFIGNGPSLDCLKIQQSGKDCKIIATNGRVIVLKKWQDEEEKVTDILVDAKQFSKALGTGKGYANLIGEDLVNDNKTTRLKTTEGYFPNTSDFFDESKKPLQTAEFCVNAKILRDVLDAMVAGEIEGVNNQVDFTLRGEGRVDISCKNSDGSEVFSVIGLLS